MRIVKRVHFPEAEVGDYVKMDGYSFKVIGTRGEEDLVVVIAPGRSAGKGYKRTKTSKPTPEELQQEEDMRETMAERMDMDYELDSE